MLLQKQLMKSEDWGSIASNYFDQFDNMIKQKSTGMEFEKRSKRPPENNCNALLSFFVYNAYAQLYGSFRIFRLGFSSRIFT